MLFGFRLELGPDLVTAIDRQVGGAGDQRLSITLTNFQDNGVAQVNVGQDQFFILVDLLSDNSMKSDVIHPNATGYRLMAEAIYDLINRAQKK